MRSCAILWTTEIFCGLLQDFSQLLDPIFVWPLMIVTWFAWSPLRQGCWVEFHPASNIAMSSKRGIDTAVNSWWMGLRCFGVSRYWGKPIDKYVAEVQLFKWTNKQVFNALKNGLMLGRNKFHPASPANFHPASRWKILLWYLTFGSIPWLHIAPIEVKSQLWSL